MISKESIKINKLYALLRDIPRCKFPRILIFTDKEFLVSEENNAKCSFSVFSNEEEFDQLSFSNDHNFRGKILEIFSKFEFVVNETIRYYLKVQENENFNDILNSLNLFSKINLLYRWGLIDKARKKQIEALKSVRNGLAHTWTGIIRYKGNYLNKQHFEIFRNDLTDFWKCLLVTYKKYQPDIDEEIKKAEMLRGQYISEQTKNER